MSAQPSNNDIPRKKTKKSSNKPIEITATRPVGRFRQVVDLPSKNIRDPRFDHFCGKFNEDLFKKSYHFVEDVKKQELEDLKHTIKKTKDASAAKNLQNKLDRELTRMRSEKDTEARAALKRKVKKEEQELIKKGKKPFYLKKSALRQIELTEKFNEAKGKSNFDKVLEKRRKRNATKEHKLVPFKRHQE
ncbi:rRNA biogenesis protein rrp36 [Entomophthora muscae]|uniref:rRNA biogenesis protein rrp36 n=1 Tax=Entomophthora muscae TaxID=34485 RepID=A0ACC2T8X2_9FUNG|nr:rRNA biogenesis protein rrp36 [Entomophthora muscae]